MFLMVGRQRELQELQAAAGCAAQGQGALVLLGGEAGIGKSSLLERLTQAPGPLRPAVGRCPGPGEAPPYGPWLEVVAKLGDTAGLPPPFGNGDAEQGGPFALAMALLRWLPKAGVPLLIAIEDLHWADSPSLELLRHLAPRLREIPVLVVATLRTDEVHRRHPLWLVLPELQRQGAHRLDLGRLTESDVAELTRAALPSAPEALEIARRLHARTGGHALFVRDLLLAARREGELPREGQPLPETVQQAIDARIHRLPATAQTVLHAAAVIGERFGYDLLARTTGLGEDEVLEALEQALSLHIIRSLGENGESFAFDHALVREVILGQLIGLRRRRWHVRVAEAMMATAAADHEVIAAHLYRAADPRAVSYLMDCAQRASNMFLLARAGELWEKALELLPESDPRRAEALALLGLNLSHVAPSRSRQCYEEALACANAVGDQVMAVLIRHWMTVPPNGICTSMAELDRLVADQEALLDHPRYQEVVCRQWRYPSEVPITASYRSRALFLNGRFQEARTEILSLLERTGAPPEEWERIRIDLEGRTQELITQLAIDVELTRREGLVMGHVGSLRSLLLTRLLLTPEQTDLIDSLAEEYRQALAEGDKRTDYPYMPPEFSPLGIYQFWRGDWEAAYANLVTYLRTGDRPQSTVSLYAPWAAWLLAERGEHESATAMTALFGPSHPDGEVFWNDGMLVRFVKGRVALAAGRLDEARRWLEGIARWMAHMPAVPLEGAYWLLLAEVNRASGDTPGARSAAERAVHEGQRHGFRYAEIAALRLLGELDGSEAHLRAALDLAERCLYGHEAALCRQSLAKVPVRDASLPAGLTEREAEVIRLVARGLTDREVGERLFISHRTVDGHLRNIFAKVGVGSRAQLSAYAAQQGLI